MVNLNAEKVRKLTEPGRYGDGGGLYLNITPNGTKSWVQRIQIGGKRTDKGLGGFPKVSLSDARKTAKANKIAVRGGSDPFIKEAKAEAAVRQRSKSTPSLYDAACAVQQTRAGTWKSAKYTERWIGTLAVHIFPTLGNTPVNDITRHDLVEVLAPLCREQPETTRKVKQRLRRIFAWAVAYEYRETNPADDALEILLPRVSRPVEHFAALPYQDVPAAIKKIRWAGCWPVTRLAFQFLIFTATRSNETRGAMWEEIDLDGAVWTIPAERMKASRPHRIPLSHQARARLSDAREKLGDDTSLVFPAPGGKQLSENALSVRAKKDGLGCVPHGFRSSFRDWSAEVSGARREAIELSLAHHVG